MKGDHAGAVIAAVLVEQSLRTWQNHESCRTSRRLQRGRAELGHQVGERVEWAGVAARGCRVQLDAETVGDALLDHQLVGRFAEHLALVLENADLHEATIEQERLKNEVMLAREIQLGLEGDRFCRRVIGPLWPCLDALSHLGWLFSGRHKSCPYQEGEGDGGQLPGEERQQGLEDYIGSCGSGQR